MAWSEEQLAAISTYDRNLLVAAAAGSGKTSVLVERVIRRLLDETQSFEIDRLLVVTFTNAAATEMRARIAAALEEALRRNPESRRIERQLILLQAAQISTIHAFCQSVVRQNFHLLDLDPKFRLAGEQEIALLVRDTVETVFETAYEAGDAAFLRFAAHYGSERGDEPLYDMILRLYRFSCSQPDPEEWLASLPERLVASGENGIDGTVWAATLGASFRLAIDEGLALTEALIQQAEATEFECYIAAFESDRAVFETLRAKLDEGWDALRAAVETVKFATLPRAPKEADAEEKARLQKLRDRLKKKVADLKDNDLTVSGEEAMADLRATRPMAEAICALTASFGAAFAEAKRARALLDFGDLEHFCLQILRDADAPPGELRPSGAALALRQRFDEVMVDEYQDVNGVQEAILSLVRREDKPNLFLVGDVKQSVYRFRLAEPELFMDKYRRYPEADGCARVDLARNFRSRPGVLAAINFLFAQLMDPDVAELGYGDAERLYPGPDYPATMLASLDGPVELHVLDGADLAENGDETDKEPNKEPEQTANAGADAAELGGFAAEARYIAARLAALMASGAVAFDKGKNAYRSLEWRDIVVLLRSVRGKADLLLEALHRENVPAYADADAGYFEEPEIRVMLALLMTIDNPRQDIPLAAVLHAPLVGLSPEELAAVRLAGPERDLYAALLKATGADASLDAMLKQKLVDFLLALGRWRTLARRGGVPELVRLLYRETGYYDYVGGLPGGLLRQANLRALYDRARQYETTNYRGLFRFLRYVEKMRASGADLAIARTLGESENVVRVMSIHKSKGLEFPVVVVADLGKSFNLQDSMATLLIHKKLGLGLYVTDDAIELRYPTVARRAIAYRMNRESKAEELRVLYVALTRAREKLILVGSVKDAAAKAQSWRQTADSAGALLPAYTIAGAKSYLDWIGPCVARHPDGAPFFEPGTPSAPDADGARWQVAVTPPGARGGAAEAGEADGDLLDLAARGEPMPGGEDAAWVKERLDWRYPDDRTADVPAKLSVTELKRRFEIDDGHAAPLFAASPLTRRPDFLRMEAEAKSSGAEYGVWMHSAMQHIDLRGDVSREGLGAQVETFVASGLLLPAQAAALDLDAAAAWFASPLGARLLASSRVRRELPFSAMIEAARFYPEVKDPAARIFVQGIVDVLFDEPDGRVLVDYKTDRAADAGLLAQKYALQISLYASAVERILGGRIKECYLYSFAAKRAIPVVRQLPGAD